MNAIHLSAALAQLGRAARPRAMLKEERQEFLGFLKEVEGMSLQLMILSQVGLAGVLPIGKQAETRCADLCHAVEAFYAASSAFTRVQPTADL